MLKGQKLCDLIWYSFYSNEVFPSNAENGEYTEEAWRKQGKAIRKELWEKVKQSKPYLKSRESWLLADACIREVIISPTGEEISIWIDNVVDYDTEPYLGLAMQPLPVTYVNVHLCLKEVQAYRLIPICDGRISGEEDNQEKHLQELLREHKEFSQWMLSDDCYETYEDGIHSLLLISLSSPEGVCIQVDCKTMEVETEINECQEGYLKDFLGIGEDGYYK